MPPSRFSTVYDFGSLRLHPDGSRVQQSNRNLRLTDKNPTVRDAHGNWFARDAAGETRVKKYRRRGSTKEPSERDDEGEKFEFADVDAEKGSVSVSAGSSKERVRNSQDEDELPVERFKTSRARKRHKFLHNHDFLESISTPSEENIARTGDGGISEDLSLALPLPSSDLLKCIHHISSCYYTEQGQLLNLSKQYRAEKKQRRLARLAEARIESKTHNEEDDNDESSSGYSDSEGEGDEDNSPPKDSKVTGNRNKKRKKKHLSPQDMYKTMDGSALMAIGMLLQEHIAETIRPYLSSNWREEENSPEEEVHEDESLHEKGASLPIDSSAENNQ